MRTRFAGTVQHADAFFVIHAISTASCLCSRVVHGPESGSSSSWNLFFFWNQNGLESIFHLSEQEQEFLNLRLILFMKGFLQLIAQFSSSLTYLQRARLLNVVKMNLRLRVSSDVMHGQYFKRQNELKLYLIKVKVHI